jgi:hypothetical protein
MGNDPISNQLARKGVETDCRRCGRDEWTYFSDEAIVPRVADHIEMAGGTAATVRACGHCGCIELYNPGLLHQQR